MRYTNRRFLYFTALSAMDAVSVRSLTIKTAEVIGNISNNTHRETETHREKQRELENNPHRQTDRQTHCRLVSPRTSGSSWRWACWWERWSWRRDRARTETCRPFPRRWWRAFHLEIPARSDSHAAYSGTWSRHCPLQPEWPLLAIVHSDQSEHWPEQTVQRAR